MSDLPEEATWEEGVTQIEITDRVLGGPNGKINVQAGQLANRTVYLKEQQENHAADGLIHKTKYTDAEARTAMGAKSNANPLHHNRHTPADILTDIKTVDGSGSGLDADLLDGKQAADFAVAGHTHPGSGGGGSPEPWIYVAPAGGPEPCYEWGWENEAMGEGLRFYKHNERVYLEGGLHSPGGMGTPLVFRLPEGYRPSQYIFFITQAVKSNGMDAPVNPTFALGDVSPTGEVMIWFSGTGQADLFSLSQVSFRVGAAPGGP